MRQITKTIVRLPIVGRVVVFFYRARMALGYYTGPLWNLCKWLFLSNEATNFTYELDETNARYLASVIADITHQTYETVFAYIQEVENDDELRNHIKEATRKSEWAFFADKDVRYGRRVGWYAIVRALKPRLVIETGVDKGLGACLLTAALRKNTQDGHPGQYLGTDIEPIAGYLFTGEYANFGRILYGDSIASLKKLVGPIDLFINDSAHSEVYEAEEYKTIADKLSPESIILGDNCHCTDKLLEFSLQTNRHFIFFHETPRDHWYPGSGIGFSFKRDLARDRSVLSENQ